MRGLDTQKKFRFLLLSFIFSLGITLTPSLHADSEMKEFIMACTYGVLTGTLVGAATLAFTEDPGENLNKVARGASLGLYAGIALGLYVVYVVPGNLEDEEDLEGLPPLEDASRFRVFPLISENGIEGVAGNFRILSF